MNILLFGIIKDIIGETEMRFQYTENVCVKDLKDHLRKEYPKLKDLRSILVAVNNEYASDNRVLQEKDEIALIPPVSGG